MNNLRNRYSSLRRNIGGQVVFDVLAWFSSIVVVAASRYDFVPGSIAFAPLIGLAMIAALLQVLIGNFFHLYRGRFRIATFDEMKSLIATTASVGVPLALVVMAFGPVLSIPRSTVLLAAPLFLVLSGAVRVLRRVLQGSGSGSEKGKRTLIYGAGSIAESLVPQLLRESRSQYHPIGLIDDDKSLNNRWISGVPMLGKWSSFTGLVKKYDVQAVIICIANADGEFLKRIEEECRIEGVSVIVFPTLMEVLQGHSGVSDLRELSIVDLVGRRPVNTKVSEIASYLEGKRILVTGAGGSIGSELCRQISGFGPSKLTMLDRDETGLQLAQLAVSGHGLLDTKDIVLADIREPDVLTQIFHHERPDVVFHAAALKHLPVLQQFPDEAWKTNVLGTLNVLKAAKAVGVKTFVNISTDKAADPTSILGKSKRIAEGLTSWFASQGSENYLSVRFGNVLGSRGSMLPTFSSLIESGGPLTVTHPEVTRFFMTIPEACQLVLQAGAIGRPQDVLILDMGQAVKILDIANRMIEISGKKIDVVFTGLRAGEKLHEDLYATSEISEIVAHPLISHARVPSLMPESLTRAMLK